jgi:hypothetical protein
MLIAKHSPHNPRRHRRWMRCLSASVVGIAVACSGFRGPGVVHGQTQVRSDSARQGPDGPRIKVTPEEINFGKVRLGKRVRASFTIANAGNGPLKFTEAPYIEVRTGCCPPVVMLGAWTLKPGEQTTLSMEFVMVGRKQGPYDFRVHLPTNDPTQPDRTVAVLSNWVP